MKIITLSREFGSGGREVGKRLADELGFAYYDREIITEIAKNIKMDEGYVDLILEKGVFSSIPLTFGHTFSFMPNMPVSSPNVFTEQQKVIKELASKSDCIIVGRNADIFLRDKNPLRLFVYADMPSKINRCKSRKSSSENMTDREMEKTIKQVDRARANSHDIISDSPWGKAQSYDLCINTSDIEVKKLIKPIAQYALNWFECR